MKKKYINTTRGMVKKGKILPIYLNYKEEKELMGYARLLEKAKCITDCNSYVRAEIGGRGKKEADTIIWGTKCYKVEFVDPWQYNKNMKKEDRDKYIHMKGFVTNKKISYFIKVASYNLEELN